MDNSFASHQAAPGIIGNSTQYQQHVQGFMQQQLLHQQQQALNARPGKNLQQFSGINIQLSHHQQQKQQAILQQLQAQQQSFLMQLQRTSISPTTPGLNPSLEEPKVVDASVDAKETDSTNYPDHLRPSMTPLSEDAKSASKAKRKPVSTKRKSITLLNPAPDKTARKSGRVGKRLSKV